MQKTYQSEIGSGGVEIRTFTQFAERDLLGFAVRLCEWEGRPLLLLYAKSWVGQQPRFASVHLMDDDFLPTLRDLKVLGVRSLKAEHTLISEEPIQIRSGLPTLEDHHTETKSLWLELTGR